MVRWHVVHHLIRELMLYEFELGYNDPTDATKIFVCVKGEGAIDHCAVTGGFEKSH